jgi:NADH:ubiquinone oxidoreductase subunit F (NADH-binding)
MSAVRARQPVSADMRLLRSGGNAGYDRHRGTYGSLPPVAVRDAKLLTEIDESGLTGRGGAAFPTAVKLAAVAGKRRREVVANGTEGEPASAKDAYLLTQNPHLVLDGLAVATRLVDAGRSTIAVAQGATAAARSLEHAIAERPTAGRPQLVRVPDRFVAGEESALVNAVTGGPAKPTGRRPFESGILVQNVETLAHLALVARFGARNFRTAGTDAEPGTALATVSGAVVRTGVVEFELGTTLGELVDRCGGLREPVDAVLIGGYFGKWLSYDPGLALSNAGLRLRGAALGARVIVLLPASVCGLVETARVARYLAEESAGQCGPCVFGLKALADELGALAAATSPDRALQRIPRLEAQIKRRGACAHPDGAIGFVTSALETFATEVDCHCAGSCSASAATPVLPTR